jgi:hypothetical protein
MTATSMASCTPPSREIAQASAWFISVWKSAVRVSSTMMALR